MEEKKKIKKIPAWSGYGLGFLFGAAIMTIFSIVMGATYFGLMLGLSISLSLGIAFECAFAGEKSLPLFQKIMLSVSALLMVLSVISLFFLDKV